MFQDNGFKLITMGDVIRDLADERRLEPTPENLGALAKEIREKGGDAAVAELCFEKLERTEDDKIVIDGIRSMAEVETFKEHFNFLLVAVHASPKTRFLRLKERYRSDDPKDLENFMKRDMRELGFSLGWSIALADHMIVNEGSIQELEQHFQRLLEKIDQ
jgi:dephospho-CoA kinase